jgi:hypothetical protein
MSNHKIARGIGLVVGAWAAIAASQAAWAGSQLESTRSTCAPINCAGMTLRGIHQVNEPFVIQVFAREGECLRLDVSTQTEDLAMLIVAPSINFGQVSDDRDAGDTRPLLALDVLPWTGWYTVAISPYDVGQTTARFTLEYGRYPGGNPNCAPAPTAAGQSFQLMGGDRSKAYSPASAAVANGTGAR